MAERDSSTPPACAKASADRFAMTMNSIILPSQQTTDNQPRTIQCRPTSS